MFSICGSGRGSGELGWNPKTDGAELDLDAFYIKEIKYVYLFIFFFTVSWGIFTWKFNPSVKKLKVFEVLT